VDVLTSVLSFLVNVNQIIKQHFDLEVLKINKLGKYLGSITSLMTYGNTNKETFTKYQIFSLLDSKISKQRTI